VDYRTSVVRKFRRPEDSRDHSIREIRNNIECNTQTSRLILETFIYGPNGHEGKTAITKGNVMKLANSTIVAMVVAGGFTLTAYVMGQGHAAGTAGPSMGTNPTGPTTSGQNMQGQMGNNPQAQTTIGPTTSATIGPTTSTTIGPTTSATIGPTTSTTVGPTTSATIGPTTSTTVGPTSSATIGPTTSATIGPTTSATIGPTSGTSKSKSTSSKAKTQPSPK